MEAVELAIPADVAAPRLMGSEGFRTKRVGGVDSEDCDSSQITAFGIGKIDKHHSLASSKGTSNSPESSSWSKKTSFESCSNATQLSSFNKDVEFDAGSAGTLLSLTAGHEAKPIHSKAARAPKTSLNGCLKRPPPTPQLETSLPLAEAEDMKAMFEKYGSHSVKCSTAESRPPKQKNILINKRGDKRNSRLPLKVKYDVHSLKSGLGSSISASGVNNTFATYGLKADMCDIAELMDDISLDGLLDGTYTCPSLGKEKGKKTGHVNENVLHSVQKAFTVLQRRVSSQAKQYDEMDDPSHQNVLPLSSTSLYAASSLEGQEENNLASDLATCGKAQETMDKDEFCFEPKDTQQVYRPADLLERLALPVAEELDYLLQNAAKPALSLSCNDPPQCSETSLPVNLPSFSWSHNYNGHSKSNSDAAKVSNRSACQGKWVRIEGMASIVGGHTDCFSSDLESLTFDRSLVPFGSVKYVLPESGNTLPTSISPSKCKLGSSSTDDQKVTETPPTPLSPRSMLAGQTLIDIANESSNLPNGGGNIKWLKPPSLKSMKARKSKSIESSANLLSTVKSETKFHYPPKYSDRFNPPKRPKLLIAGKKESSIPLIASPIGQSSSSYSAPRSNRSSPLKMRDHPAFEGHHKPVTNSSFSRQPGSTPAAPLPPPRFVDTKNSNHSQRKLRKVVQIDWNRAKG